MLRVSEHDLTLAKIRDSSLQIPASHIVVALGVTFINYAVILVCYDYLAFRFAKVPISLARVAFAALTSYPFSYNFGATLAGIPLRYRLYSSWGIPLDEDRAVAGDPGLDVLVRRVFHFRRALRLRRRCEFPTSQLQSICTALVTTWHIHEDAVSGSPTCFPIRGPSASLLLALAAALRRRQPIASRFAEDLSLDAAGSALPPDHLPDRHCLGRHAGGRLGALRPLSAGPGGYLTMLEVYLVAYVLIVLSHVPGGWGVLEAVMMTLLGTLQLVPDPDSEHAQGACRDHCLSRDLLPASPAVCGGHDGLARICLAEAMDSADRRKPPIWPTAQ